MERTAGCQSMPNYVRNVQVAEVAVAAHIPTVTASLLSTCLPLELTKTQMAEHTCKGFFFSIKSFEVGRFLIWIFEVGRSIFNLGHTFRWQPL